MSFAYRSSTGMLDHNDEPPRRPERWDRDRFERARSRGPPEERESFRYSEREREGPRGRADVTVVEDHHEGRGARGRYEEEARLYDEDRFERRPGRRPAFLDREEPSPAEIANRALAPYRRKTVVERGHSPPVRRPARPAFSRRQSSLDTFDRRPRYEERDEWRPPANVDIPLPIRRRPSPVRRRSPPRDRYREDDFEEIRYRDAEPEFREYRDVEVRREKSRISRRSPRGFDAPPAPSRSSSSSFEEIREVSPVRLPGRKGKTRMPKRLVHRNAIVQLGYPFDEEDNFYVVKRALEKDHIDEIIKISETYKQEGGRTTYRYEEQTVEQPPPPPSEIAPPPPPTVAEPLPPPPPPQSVSVPPPPASVHLAHSVRTASPRREYIEEREEISNHIGGPFTVVVPDRHHRSDRDINEEIVRLENERRALQLEREAREIREIGYRETDRETEYEMIEERRPKRNVVRIEKDRKARHRSRSRRRPDPKLVAAMMSTLI